MEIKSLQMLLIKMRSYRIGRALNLRVLSFEGDMRRYTGKRPSEDRGRDESDAATSQGHQGLPAATKS